MFRAHATPQDWPAIAVWAAARGRRLDAANPRQFAGGLANLNYLVGLDGAPAVFRRPPPGPLAAGASDMAREARVLAALNPAYPLAPRLLLAAADDTPIDAPFLLLEHRPGIAVGGALPAPFTPADAPWMIGALAKALASLHALPPPPIGKPTGFNARQLSGWTARAQAAFGDPLPAPIAALLAALNPPPPDTPAAPLHMDAKLDNLLLDPEARSAAALIDWDMGTLGPPAFDLAVVLSYWIEPADPAPLHALKAMPTLAPGWPPRVAMVEAYARAAGGVPADLPWHLGLARLRLAVAWQQLYRLWQRGALAGQRYSGFETLALAVAAHAADTLGDQP